MEITLVEALWLKYKVVSLNDNNHGLAVHYFIIRQIRQINISHVSQRRFRGCVKKKKKYVSVNFNSVKLQFIPSTSTIIDILMLYNSESESTTGASMDRVSSSKLK